MTFTDLLDFLPHRSFKRHWHPQSEIVTGADSLMTALYNGWTLYSEDVMLQRVPLSSGRTVAVYYFKLLNGEQRRIMPVSANPFVERLIRNQNLQVRELAPMETPDATPIRMVTVLATESTRTA